MMQVRRAWFASTIWFASTMMILLLLTGVSALASAMQLLSPSKGWSLGGGGRLFWTEDNGGHWSDITPGQPGSFIADVFFLDETRAWVLLKADAGDDRVRFELATTTNAGHSWSFAPVSIPKQYSAELSGTAWLDFADAEHGWIVLRKATSSAFSIGRLLATQDGGNTWHELPQPPLGEPALFVNSTDGWMAGDSGAGGFYHSRDGGNTWEGIDLQLPSPSSLPTRAAYGPLRFTDPKHGSIAVVFSPITDQTKGSTLVLFTTVDGGKSWKADRVLPDLRNMYGEASFPSALVDSTLISVPDRTLTTIEPDGTPSKRVISGVRKDTTVKEISFVSPTIGWLRMSDDRLLSTTDGGETLIWLVPGSAPRTLPPATPELPRAKMRPIGPGPLIAAPMSAYPQATPAAAGLHYTERLGFDKHNVWASTSTGTGTQMTTWWAKSPFYDVGFYVGGANYCYSFNSTTKTCTTRLDPNVISGWVTQATTQGWGLMPIWVGEQAPCNTGSVTKFDETPATAQSEGGIEALNAATAMTALGLSGTVIFYDMESYSATAGSACSLAVRAFLTGWVNGMNANGFATTAVYGNTGPAERDFSQVANLSEVWISSVSVTGNKQPRVTVWGLGSGSTALEDILWESSQRGHQFLLDAASINYGGVTASIDYDVENFQIPGGSNTKPYSWTVSSTVDPDTTWGSWVTGINDVVFNSTTGYNNFVTKGQIGQIVGYTNTEGPVGACTGDCFTSFIDNNGTLTFFLDPNSLGFTLVSGINNATQAVGYYCYGTYSQPGYQGDIYCDPPPDYNTYTESGFIGSSLLSSPSFADIDYSRTGFTYPQGINDDGQVITVAQTDCKGSTCSGLVTFVDQNGTILSPFSPLTCPEQSSTLYILGINGFTQLVGYYYDSNGAAHGFVYNMNPPSSQNCFQIDVPGAYSTELRGINNQGQVVGYYRLNEDDLPCFFFMDNGTAYSTPYNMWQINDAMQFTGYKGDTDSDGCGTDYLGSPTFSVMSPI